MNVMVEIELTRKPQKKHRDEMNRAAKHLTNSLESINIYVKKENPKTIVAEFTIKKSAQYKVVDEISEEFVDDMDDYNDSMIMFP